MQEHIYIEMHNRLIDAWSRRVETVFVVTEEVEIGSAGDGPALAIVRTAECSSIEFAKELAELLSEATGKPYEHRQANL